MKKKMNTYQVKKKRRCFFYRDVIFLLEGCCFFCSDLKYNKQTLLSWRNFFLSGDRGGCCSLDCVEGRGRDVCLPLVLVCRKHLAARH
jgi:hypothetical protein